MLSKLVLDSIIPFLKLRCLIIGQYLSFISCLNLQLRKSQVKFQVTDFEDNPIANAKISLKQIKLAFPFGNAMSEAIIDDKTYQSWFTSRFKYTVFENEMKWYSNEKYPRQENYSIPDAMLKFAHKHKITVRGHNILWDDPR